jgi:hypothetical protein
MLGKTVISADCQIERLHGGTLGDVRLVAGTAETAGGRRIPVKAVWKTQKKWERRGDPGSWRREYDLYTSELHTVFTDRLRWPVCYHAEIHDDEIQLWLEYIDGVSGGGLTADMMEQAAEELGRLQGRLYAQPPAFLKDAANLNTKEYLQTEYRHWTPETAEYQYLRAGDCALPEHLRRMLTGMDDQADAMLERIERLPVVFCHQDFWIENVFWTDGKIRLIDWDTTGWGYLGEDVAALIADEIQYENLDEYYRRLIPAYYKGVSEYMDVSSIRENCILEIILLRFGYRFVQTYLFSPSPEERDGCVTALQKIYDISRGLR